MKVRKMMPILEDNRKNGKNGKNKHGLHNHRVTIPIQLVQMLNHYISKGDFIEWEVDTVKKTLIGRLVKNDCPKPVKSVKTKVAKQKMKPKIKTEPKTKLSPNPIHRLLSLGLSKEDISARTKIPLSVIEKQLKQS